MELLDVQGKVEEAFDRVLRAHVDAGDYGTMQLSKRFFGLRPSLPRIAVVVDECDCSLRDEDGSPLQYHAAVRIELTSHGKDDGRKHDDVLARIALDVYGGSAFVAKLNEVMAGEGFRALSWESDANRSSTKDGHYLKTTLTGNIELQPWDEVTNGN